jgi:DOPA 4,5-dioxygenase
VRNGGGSLDGIMSHRTVTHFHAHIYYDPAKSRGRAELLRERVAADFLQAKLGRWHDELVGPHPQSMFQIAFPAEMLAAFVPWLMLNRDDLVVLLHPETGDDLADHTPRMRPGLAPSCRCGWSLSPRRNNSASVHGNAVPQRELVRTDIGVNRYK